MASPAPTPRASPDALRAEPAATNHIREVVDRGLVTSRKPDDLPIFIAQLIEAFAVGATREVSWKGEAYAPAAFSA